MSSTYNSEEREELTQFFKEAEEEELKALVSTSDKFGSFKYDDIRENDVEDVSPKVWGKAIEIGVLEPDNNKYKLLKRAEISKYLSGNWIESSTEKTESEGEDPQESTSNRNLPSIDYDKASWSRNDKLAAVVGVVSMTGFAFDPVRSIIMLIVGTPLSPLMSLMPFFAVVFIVAMITGIWSTVVREKIVDVDVSEFREYINELRGDEGGMFGIPDDATQEEEDKMMEAQQSMMKAQMKPFGWTMCVTLPFIVWIFTIATFGDVGTITFPLIGEHTWAGTVIGPLRTWIVWYAACSIVMGQLVKNLIDF